MQTDFYDLKPLFLHQFREQLLTWFQINQRSLPWRQTRDPYRIWISEVMLQQTQVTTVMPYFENFINQFPDIRVLAAADLQTVLKAWEKLGYYARARNLHRATKIIVEDYQGIIPDNYQQLRQLPGVGEYIAAALLSIAFNQPFAVVDGNVKRVLARLFLIEAPINQSGSKTIFADVAERLLDRHNPGIFNQALMELGATICRPQTPICDRCPLRQFCQAFETNRQSDFPRRLKKQAIPTYQMVAGVVVKAGKMLIVQRPTSGLLGGLWEFPGGPIEANQSGEAACVQNIKLVTNLSVAINAYLISIQHAYTHFKIELDVFMGQYLSGRVKLNGPIDHRWLRPKAFENFPFTGATHKFMPAILNWMETNRCGDEN